MSSYLRMCTIANKYSYPFELFQVVYYHLSPDHVRIYMHIKLIAMQVKENHKFLDAQTKNKAIYVSLLTGK